MLLRAAPGAGGLAGFLACLAVGGAGGADAEGFVDGAALAFPEAEGVGEAALRATDGNRPQGLAESSRPLFPLYGIMKRVELALK